MKRLLTTYLWLAFPLFLLGATKASLEVKKWGQSPEVPTGGITAIAQTPDGYLWLGTKKGLVRFDGKRFFLIKKDAYPELPDDKINALAVDKVGNLWIGTQNGLAQYYGGQFYAYTTYDTEALKSNIIQTLHIGNSDALWIGTGGGGVTKFEKNSFSALRGAPSSLSVFSLCESDSGLWIGSGSGLARFEQDSLRFIPNSPKHILSLARYEKGLICASEKGTLLFDGSSFKPFFSKSQAASKSVVVASDKSIWIGTNGDGLYQQTQVKVEHLSVKTGLLYDFINVVFEDRDGSIWIGMENGLQQFKSEKRANRVPNVIIENIFLDERSLLQSGSGVQDVLSKNFQRLLLPPSRFTVAQEINQIVFRFTTPEFIEPNEVRYQCRLNDEAWTDVGAQPIKQYVSPPPKDYTFSVRASFFGSNTFGEAATVSFVKAAHFYETTLFYILVSVFLFILFAVLVVLDRHRREREKKELQKLANEQNKELQQALYNIAEKSEDLEKINRLVQSINSEMSLKPLLNVILERMIKNVERASVLLFNPKTDSFSFVSSIGYDADDLQSISLSGEDIQERYLSHAVQLVDDVFVFENVPERTLRPIQKEGQAPVYVRKEKIGIEDFTPHLPKPAVILIMRIVNHGKAQAYLLFENTESPQGFDRKEVRLLKNLRDHIVSAIIKTQLLEELQNQRDELRAANEQIEKALADLRAAQSQLVHAEKMASLGELTAGIAHEIQNPLNFVNNFSEVSVDLMKDLKDELEKSPLDKGYVDDLLSDLSGNMEKISHHGKRASSIVKGMLEHSRQSSGEKSELDLNALLKEYLNLAFHGYRAKDKTFNATLTVNLDDSIPKITGSQQELSRVFLNIFTNGFYAVHQKKQELGEAFSPELMISTKRLGEKIEARIRDNGKGIPQSVLNKVFQPFFTTKPTGQGTGLGLSISYDIITKGHRGDLKVETQEGAFAEFIITLPINA